MRKIITTSTEEENIKTTLLVPDKVKKNKSVLIEFEVENLTSSDIKILYTIRVIERQSEIIMEETDSTTLLAKEKKIISAKKSFIAKGKFYTIDVSVGEV